MARTAAKLEVVTIGNVEKTLIDFVKSTTTQRDNFQLILEFGFRYYMGQEKGAKGQDIEPGNALYLTKALNAAVVTKSIRANTVKNYIEHHANVVAHKGEDGGFVFKKVQPKGEDKPAPAVKELEYKWYAFDNDGNVKLADYKADLIRVTKNALNPPKGKEYAKLEPVQILDALLEAGISAADVVAILSMEKVA